MTLTPTRQTLITLLSDGQFQSGEQLGEQLGISRAAVSKHMAALKELGLAEMSGDALIRAMHQHPKLIERPIVIKNGQARIGRPPELVLEILK